MPSVGCCGFWWYCEKCVLHICWCFFLWFFRSLGIFLPPTETLWLDWMRVGVVVAIVLLPRLRGHQRLLILLCREDLNQGVECGTGCCRWTQWFIMIYPQLFVHTNGKVLPALVSEENGLATQCSPRHFCSSPLVLKESFANGWLHLIPPRPKHKTGWLFQTHYIIAHLFRWIQVHICWHGFTPTLQDQTIPEDIRCIYLCKFT